jgi:hypothetical protein
MAISIVRLAQGSKEYVDVAITDATSQVTDLSTSNPHFDVKDDSGVAKQSGVAAIVTPDGMTFQCLVDTTAGGLWPLGHYNLYVYWTIAPESPREGPFDLYVV